MAQVTYSYQEWMHKAVQDASKGRSTFVASVPAAYQAAYAEAFNFGNYFKLLLNNTNL